MNQHRSLTVNHVEIRLWILKLVPCERGLWNRKDSSKVKESLVDSLRNPIAVGRHWNRHSKSYMASSQQYNEESIIVALRNGMQTHGEIMSKETASLVVITAKLILIANSNLLRTGAYVCADVWTSCKVKREATEKQTRFTILKILPWHTYIP